MSTPLVVKISTIRMKPPTSTTKLQERPWQIDATNTSLSDTSYVWAIPYGMLYKVKPTIAFFEKYRLTRAIPWWLWLSSYQRNCGAPGIFAVQRAVWDLRGRIRMATSLDFLKGYIGEICCEIMSVYSIIYVPPHCWLRLAHVLSPSFKWLHHGTSRAGNGGDRDPFSSPVSLKFDSSQYTYHHNPKAYTVMHSLNV